MMTLWRLYQTCSIVKISRTKRYSNE